MDKGKSILTLAYTVVQYIVFFVEYRLQYPLE